MVKVVIYVSTLAKWFFLGFYDPLLQWALTKVKSSIRVLVPDVDVVRYRKEGALVLTVNPHQADVIRTAIFRLHGVWLVDSIQEIRL